MSDGPKAPEGHFGNSALDQLNQQGEGASRGYSGLNDYAMGKKSLSDVMGTDLGNANWNIGRNNELATGAATGSRFAADQLQNNPVYAGLFGGPNGQKGQLQDAEDQLSSLQKTGYQLKPEDMDLFGSTAGAISRLYGQQEAAAGQSLADRGLASAPNGAASATFSGLQGNKSEMLQQAMQGIMQQRWNDTFQRIGQQASIMQNLGSQYSGALQNQWQRQLSGSQNQHQNLTSAAGLQQGANQQQNGYGLDKANFDTAHTPLNIADYGTAGIGNAVYKAGSNSGALFGGSPDTGNEPPPGMTGPKQPGKRF